jgi:hypothetical protein
MIHRDTFDRWSPLLALLACAVVFWLGARFGSRTASGADSFGYVSQAYLWLDGDIRIDQPFAQEVPWPHGRMSLAPLGYREGGDGTIVPTYASGIPLIMAAFILLFGACGPYFVTPLFGALLVAGTFVLGWRLTGSRSAALAASLLMASSPAFLFNVMWPMSDTATAALWVASMCALTWPGLRPAILAGMLAGVAVLVRPNLAPLAIAGILAAETWARTDGTPRWRRAAVFLASGIIPAALAVAAVNAHLYGSPLLSGYGPAEGLYALAFLTVNVRQYASWLVETEGAALWILALPLVWKAARPAGMRVMLPLVVFAVIVCLSYLFYLPFAEWWYLRFLLPAFPVVFVGLSSILLAITRARGSRLVLAGLTIIVLAGVSARVRMALDRDVLATGLVESRYQAIAQFVERGLPPNAAILSMQHSGSIRFYAGRLTIRYEFFSAARLPDALQWLRDRGYSPYLLLEDWEEKDYRARFAAAGPLGRLEIPLVAEMTTPVRVRIYDPLGTLADARDPFEIVVTGRRCTHPAPGWRAVGHGRAR